MAAVVLVDLKRFTALTDRDEPMQVVGWLDQHLEALGSGIEAHGGEIIKSRWRAVWKATCPSTFCMT